jgi:hypothetical protein
MSILSASISRAEITAQMILSGEYHYVEVERNVGGVRYEVFGIEFYHGGEMQKVMELQRVKPSFGILDFFAETEPSGIISEELRKKAMSSIGLKIEQP